MQTPIHPDVCAVQMGEQRLVWNDEMKLRLIKVQLLGQQNAKLVTACSVPQWFCRIKVRSHDAHSMPAQSIQHAQGCTLNLVHVMQRIAADTLDIGEAEMEVRLQVHGPAPGCRRHVRGLLVPALFRVRSAAAHCPAACTAGLLQ